MPSLIITSLVGDGGELSGPTFFGDKYLPEDSDIVQHLQGEMMTEELDGAANGPPYIDTYKTSFPPRHVLDILEEMKFELRSCQLGEGMAVWTLYQAPQKTKIAAKKEVAAHASTAAVTKKPGRKPKAPAGTQDALDEEMEPDQHGSKVNGKAGKASSTAAAKRSTRAGSKNKQTVEKDESGEE